jgi:hypothetical protein
MKTTTIGQQLSKLPAILLKSTTLTQVADGISTFLFMPATAAPERERAREREREERGISSRNLLTRKPTSFFKFK